MTQSFNLSQLANNLDSSGRLDAADGLVNAVPIANGGTGATTLTGYVKGAGTTALTASSTIPNTDITGLGTMSTQNANSVAVTGGAINGTTVGATTASTGAFTTVSASGVITSTVVTGTAPFTVASTTQVANLNAATAGTAGSATTATNLAGGVASQIPYQTGAGATAFIANGTAGQVLTSAGTGAPAFGGISGGTF
jgi:hypothetical protein